MMKDKYILHVDIDDYDEDEIEFEISAFGVGQRQIKLFYLKQVMVFL